MKVKRKSLQEIRAWADHVVDGAGQHIDPEIKELVVRLNAVGIPTSYSCGGHYDGSGLPAPWVSYDTRIGGARVRKKLRGYLQLFYAQHVALPGARLSVVSEFGGYNLRNESCVELRVAFLSKSLTGSALQKAVQECQGEMLAFAEFLGRCMNE